MNRFFRVGVGQALNQRTDFNFDAEFLPKFTDQAVLKGFSRFTLTPWEFPEPTEVGIRVALGDEEGSLPENKPRGDVNDSHGVGKRSNKTVFQSISFSVFPFGFYRPILL